ncbi:MAG: M48 family metallopeptidase [Chitinophagales bacterium]
MRKLSVILFLGILSLTCNRVPLTDRKQVSLLPESELVAMSLAAYADFLDTSEVVSSGKDVDMVTRVAKNISISVEKILKTEGYEDRLADFKWEFNVIESDQVNAWCMPGGKVVVYTGILPITKDENGLAVVIGHEIAHAVARHGNERMSQQLIAYTGFTALDLALTNKPEQTRSLLLTAVGVGATVGVLLPFSRSQESEADRLGLIFMADAGYNPNHAVGFWQRMSEQSGGAEIPEFLSTHPSDETRIENIQTIYIPEAIKYYKPAK